MILDINKKSIEKQCIAEFKTDKFEELKKYQLPYHFKKIGFGIFVFSFISMFIVVFTINNVELRQYIKYGILFGLLIISISKEKIEDEYISQLLLAIQVGIFHFLKRR